MLKYIMMLGLSTFFVGCSFNDPTIPEEKNESKQEIILKEPNFERGENFEENFVTNVDLIKNENIEDKINQELANLEDSEENPQLEDIGITKITDIDMKKENLGMNDLFYKLHFEYNKYSLNENEKEKLKKLIRFLKDNENELENKNIIIEGNADQQGTDEYNYALGIKRAHYIMEQIIFNTTILNKNIKIISYGETNTICSEETEDCYQNNRRVEIKFK